MSDFNSSLVQASQKNKDLLATMDQTEYAPPALKQNTSYISNLESQLKETDRELKKLHATTEDEREEHLKYKESTVKRFVHKLGGSKGQDKFDAKAEKEEREFLDAWQREREAKERKNELTKALDHAKSENHRLDSDTTRHDQAQKELDQLYASIFSGPTPEVQGEDRLEDVVKQARDHFQRCQSTANAERHVLEALSNANRCLASAAAEMGNAKDSSRADMIGFGGTFADMMERDGLSKAQLHVSESLRHMDEAMRTSPQGAVKPLPSVNIDNGHLMSDVMFDNIFSDMKQHDRIKAGDADVQKAGQESLDRYREQEGRVKEADGRVKQAEADLREARGELQRLRAEAFEGVGNGGGGAAPPAYSG